MPELHNFLSYTAANAVTANWPGGNFWTHWAFFTFVIIILVQVMVLGFIFLERRILGRMQARIGPNRTGPFGLLQPVADAMKVLLKEDIVPDRADKVVWWLAPIVALFPTLLVFAAIPFEDGALLADLNIGILYVLAVTSVPSVGIFMAGWGSNNKYSVLGAMRDIAALVGYEIPLMLSTVGVILIAGSLSLTQIVEAQSIPFILLQPLGFMIFFIGGLAEINRTPFDLLEADSEIVAGHHTDYSGMKFAMFYLVEYTEALALSAIVTTVFLGGWKGPFLPPWIWFVIKVFAVFGIMIWARATFPRVRIDQLMALAWKFLLPLSIINLIITGIEVVVWPSGFSWQMVIINFVIMIVLILIWSRLFKLGRGKVEVREVWDRVGQRNAADCQIPVSPPGNNRIS